MRFTIPITGSVLAVLFFALLNPALASPKVSRVTGLRYCKSNDPPAENIRETQLIAESARAGPNIQISALAVTTELKVWFHVVSNSTEVSDGNIPDEVLVKQLAVINKDFSPAGISFVLDGITRTVNDSWSTAFLDSTSDLAMKRALRKGSYRDLNVYICNLGPEIIGWCSFPLPNPNLRDVKTKDGCTINFDSLPGGPYPDFDQGHTLTHEIGHWLNLQHTFRGGCEGGDMVRDTPAEEVPIYGCPTYFPDTCTGPKYPGLDPIHNYMGYTTDSCMTEFTPGQITRMFRSLSRFRRV